MARPGDVDDGLGWCLLLVAIVKVAVVSKMPTHGEGFTALRASNKGVKVGMA